MERNRRLQAERRTQVEKLQLEQRALQEKAREMRRWGGGVSSPLDATAQQHQQQHQHQHSPSGSVQQQHQQHQQQRQQQQQQQPLGLRRGAGLVSSFGAGAAPQQAEASAKRRAAPAALAPARVPLVKALRGLRLRRGQRQSFERGQRTRAGRVLLLRPGMTLRQLAVGMRLKLSPLFQKLAAAGEVHRSPSEVFDADVAQLIAEELGMVVKRADDRRRDRVRSPRPAPEVLAREGAPHRAPVVTVMGHVDHGKTSLLDALRSASVASREAGGITQAIAAFSVAMRAASEGTGSVRAPGGKAARATEAAGGAAPGGALEQERELEQELELERELAAELAAEGGGEAGGLAAAPGKQRREGGGGRARTKAAKQARKRSDSSAAAAAAATAAAAEGALLAPLQAPSNVDVMTFIDTPGHALFSSMRKHGSSVTDIVVLVVDGKDGVMPQTRECLELITAAAMPCVVAVTKCDTVDPVDAVARTAEALLAAGFSTEPYGGDVPLVAVSARTGYGLEALKAALAFQAELQDLRARARVLPEAVVLDSRLVAGQGQVVDAIVLQGTLRVGDYLVAEGEMGRVKALFTDAVGAQSLNRRLLAAGAGAGAGAKAQPAGKGSAKGKEGAATAAAAAAAAASDAAAAAAGGIKLQSVQEALPGTPVRIVGLKGTPAAGADLLGVEDEARASAVLEGRARRAAAQEAIAISAVDAAVRRADRNAYKARRDRTVAYMLAVSRERQRASLRKSGQLIPPRLQQLPWEVTIMAEARAGTIAGVSSSGRKERAQGGQQSTYVATAAVGGGGGGGGGGGSSGEPAAPPAPVASLMLRADSMGSLAALRDAVARIGAATDAVVPRVVTASVGDVSEKDVEYAAAMGAHIVGFGARASPAIAKLAERRKVVLNVGKVIYHVLDALCLQLGSYLPTELEEEVVSTAEVKQVFALNATKARAASEAAGCVVTMGTFLKAAKLFRVTREGEVLHTATELGSLQHLQKKVESVKKGDECGIALSDFLGVQVGDRIEALVVKKKAVKIKVDWD